MIFSPLGWESLPFFGLLIPCAFLEYVLWHGHPLVGATGLTIWLPLVWVLLVRFHRMGRVRMWLSAPVILISNVVMTLIFAGESGGSLL